MAVRPIKIVAGYPAGGQTDLFARTYGDFLAKQLGQPVLVENKAGAGGTVAAVDVKRAPPDGYTLMFTISTTMIMNRALMKSIAYDAEKDFVLISIMPSGSLPLIAGSKTGAKNLNDFIAYARRVGRVSTRRHAAGHHPQDIPAAGRGRQRPEGAGDDEELWRRGSRAEP